MPLAVPNVLLLAGRLAQWSEAGRLRPLLAGLQERQLKVAVLCVANGGILDDRSGLIQCPGLGNRWQRPWALRRLPLGADAKAPHLLHVLQREMTRVGLQLADRWRIPYVQSIEDFIPAGGRLPVSRRWCRAIVAPGHELANDLIHSLGVPEHLVCVVPPAVPVDFERPKSPAALTSSARVPVVGATGPIVEGSGLAIFLAAARLVFDAGVDAEFVIAGHGPREAELRRGAEGLRIADRVTFAAEPTARGTFWNVLDLFCQPSLVPSAGRSVALAQAHGVPVVATNVDGLRSLVVDQSTGFRVPPGDAAALARTIITALADPAQAQQRARRGRDQVIEAFHPSREADLLAELYHRIAAQAERPRAAMAPTG